jgi:hypothetical protein
MRRKAAVEAAAASGKASPPVPAPNRASRTWAMLIKRVYEVDPPACPKCGGEMKVIAFIEPPQGAVVEKILRHCGLWNPATHRPPPTGQSWVHDPECRGASLDELRELTYIDIDTFEATF